MVDPISGSKPLIPASNVDSSLQENIKSPTDTRITDLVQGSGVFSSASESGDQTPLNLSGHRISTQDKDAPTSNLANNVLIGSPVKSSEDTATQGQVTKVPQDYEPLSEFTSDEIISVWNEIQKPDVRTRLVKDKLVPFFQGPSFRYGAHEKFARSIVQEYKNNIPYIDKQVIWGRLQREPLDMAYAKHPEDLIFEWPEFANRFSEDANSPEEYLDDVVKEKLAPFLAGKVEEIPCDYDTYCEAAVHLLKTFPESFSQEQKNMIHEKLEDTLNQLHQKDVLVMSDSERVDHISTIELLENYLK